MTEKLKGKVERIHDEPMEGEHGAFTRRGILIGGKWYNGIPKDKTWDAFREGDEVLLELQKNGKYTNIVKLTNISGNVCEPEDFYEDQEPPQKPPKPAQNKDFSQTANNLPALSALDYLRAIDEFVQRNKTPPEVWEKKDQQIIRQNSLAHADQWMGAKIAVGEKPTEEEYFKFAQRCVDWVNSKPNQKQDETAGGNIPSPPIPAPGADKKGKKGVA